MVVLHVTFMHCSDVACFLMCCFNVLWTQLVYGVFYNILCIVMHV